MHLSGRYKDTHSECRPITGLCKDIWMKISQIGCMIESKCIRWTGDASRKRGEQGKCKASSLQYKRGENVIYHFKCDALRSPWRRDNRLYCIIDKGRESALQCDGKR